LTSEEKAEIERQSFCCDVFLTSANALTEDGLIINIDGKGNRVAATIFGPKKVYFVVGANKLVKNYSDAISRIRNYAAPLNAKRLGLATPCVESSSCQDCCSKQRICNYTTIIKRGYQEERITVLFVKEHLGL
jgi:hypothetical protein